MRASTMSKVLGTAAILALGGLLADAYGWRLTFVAVGVPGLAVALLVRLTVREPVRGAADAQSAGGEAGSDGSRGVGGYFWIGRQATRHAQVFEESGRPGNGSVDAGVVDAEGGEFIGHADLFAQADHVIVETVELTLDAAKKLYQAAI